MAKKGYKLVFAGDVHGNISQYTKIFNRAEKDDVDALVFGGDLSPKGTFTGSMNVQREFFKTFLIPKIQDFVDDTGKKVFLMMGNDDWAGNYHFLKGYEEDDFKVLDDLEDGPHKLNDHFDIIGYPYVPVTPFRMKDWEKWDLNFHNDVELERSMLLHGTITWNGRYEGKHFNPEDRHDSIQNDLKEIFKTIKPKKTICVFHTPPFNTKLDVLYTREHIGSLGIRMAIEEHKPLLTLHAHIHESVDITGEFTDKIGPTICASVGNHNSPDKPYVLMIDLPRLDIRREKLE
jgi:Icc-related predicted phosphoesterase